MYSYDIAFHCLVTLSNLALDLITKSWISVSPSVFIFQTIELMQKFFGIELYN